MAKRGEGDPRWIVEDRPDATNVNNWHWTEKNATPWSRDFMRAVFDGLELEGEAGKVSFSDIEVEGEATANNRKAKLIFFYELEVGMKWKGKTSDGKSVSGKLKVPNVSEEYEPDEYEVDVSMKSESTPARDKVKEMVRKQGAELVKEKLNDWYKALRIEFTQGMILPTKKKVDNAQANNPVGVLIHKEKKADLASSSSSSGKNDVGSLTLTEISINDEFRCSPSDLFRCLMDEERVKAYTQANAKIDSKLGGAFSMFNENVSGVIKDLVPNEKLVLAWRFNTWPEGHFSEVSIKLTEGKGITHVALRQTSIPTQDAERAKVGWQRHQFDRIKAMFGFGSSLAGLM